MAQLVGPAIHVFLERCTKDVDARHEAGQTTKTAYARKHESHANPELLRSLRLSQAEG
jgi:hypothetical protein